MIIIWLKLIEWRDGQDVQYKPSEYVVYCYAFQIFNQIEIIIVKGGEKHNENVNSKNDVNHEVR